jgi:uncharacterized peroxidase-related enzyme
MSRFSSVSPEAATGATAEVFAKIKKAVGKVPNGYLTIGSHTPAGLTAILAADAAVVSGSLSKADIEAIKLAVSETGGCDYCVAAHTAVGKMVGLKPEEMKQIRAGEATGAAQRDTLVRFVRHVIGSSGTVDAAEVETIRAAGYSETQIIEALLAVSVITFSNLVNRVNATTLDFPAVA